MGPHEGSRNGTLSVAGSFWVRFCCDVTMPHLPYPSLNKLPVLSSPPPLSDRNPCSCPGWDRAHTAVFALAVVGIAVVIVVVMLVLVTAVTKSMSGADVVDVKRNIEMADWRKVRVRVQRMRLCQRYWRRPWRSKWVPNDFLCSGGVSLRRPGIAERIDRSSHVLESRHTRACEWRVL